MKAVARQEHPAGQPFNAGAKSGVGVLPLQSQNDLQQLQQELVAALAGLDASQTQLSPAGQAANGTPRWNIQQIVRHLLLSYEATIAAMEARLTKATPTKAKPSPAQRLWQFVLLRLQHFPGGRPAPEAVTPKPEVEALDGPMLQAEVTAALEQMAQRIDAAERLFGPDRQAVSHMLLGPMSVAQWRRFHLVHGRHHILQIERILSDHTIATEPNE